MVHMSWWVGPTGAGCHRQSVCGLNVQCAPMFAHQSPWPDDMLGDSESWRGFKDEGMADGGGDGTHSAHPSAVHECLPTEWLHATEGERLGRPLTTSTENVMRQHTYDGNSGVVVGAMWGEREVHGYECGWHDRRGGGWREW
jgi:hypothetical protein